MDNINYKLNRIYFNINHLKNILDSKIRDNTFFNMRAELINKSIIYLHHNELELKTMLNSEININSINEIIVNINTFKNRLNSFKNSQSESLKDTVEFKNSQSESLKETETVDFKNKGVSLSANEYKILSYNRDYVNELLPIIQNIKI